jgi:hypothetical protein
MPHLSLKKKKKKVNNKFFAFQLLGGATSIVLP